MNREMSPARDYLTICDTNVVEIVDEGRPANSNEQVIGVIEHLLHGVYNGLAKAFPSQWGTSSSSDIYDAMMEAAANGAYDPSVYDDVPEEAARLRIQLQEFHYWGESTIWGIHNT